MAGRFWQAGKHKTVLTLSNQLGADAALQDRMQCLKFDRLFVKVTFATDVTFSFTT